MTFLRDTGLVFWAQLRSNLRNPLWVIIGLSQPVLYLVLFGPLLEGIGGSLGAGPVADLHAGTDHADRIVRRVVRRVRDGL